MLDTHDIVWGIVIPAVITVAAVMIRGIVSPLQRFGSLGIWMAILYAVCYLGFRKWPTIGASVHDWVPFVAIAAGLLVWCGRCGDASLWVRIGTRAALIGASLYLLLRPQFPSLDVEGTILWCGIGGMLWLGTVVVSESLHRSLATPHAPVSPMALTCSAGFTAISLVLFNTMMLGQLTGMLAIILLLITMMSWIRPSLWSDTTLVTLTGLVVPALALLGVRYADLPWWGAILILLTFFAPVIVKLPILRDKPGWLRTAAVIGASGIVVSPVLIVGIKTTIAAMQGPDSDYYY